MAQPARQTEPQVAAPQRREATLKRWESHGVYVEKVAATAKLPHPYSKTWKGLRAANIAAHECVVGGPIVYVFTEAAGVSDGVSLPETPYVVPRKMLDWFATKSPREDVRREFAAFLAQFDDPPAGSVPADNRAKCTPAARPRVDAAPAAPPGKRADGLSRGGDPAVPKRPCKVDEKKPAEKERPAAAAARSPARPATKAKTASKAKTAAKVPAPTEWDRVKSRRGAAAADPQPLFQAPVRIDALSGLKQHVEDRPATRAVFLSLAGSHEVYEFRTDAAGVFEDINARHAALMAGAPADVGGYAGVEVV
jgi:hypothetical protein